MHDLANSHPPMFYTRDKLCPFNCNDIGNLHHLFVRSQAGLEFIEFPERTIFSAEIGMLNKLLYICQQRVAAVFRKEYKLFFL